MRGGGGRCEWRRAACLCVCVGVCVRYPSEMCERVSGGGVSGGSGRSAHIFLLIRERPPTSHVRLSSRPPRAKRRRAAATAAAGASNTHKAAAAAKAAAARRSTAHAAAAHAWRWLATSVGGDACPPELLILLVAQQQASEDVDVSEGRELRLIGVCDRDSAEVWIRERRPHGNEKRGDGCRDHGCRPSNC